VDWTGKLKGGSLLACGVVLATADTFTADRFDWFGDGSCPNGARRAPNPKTTTAQGKNSSNLCFINLCFIEDAPG